jgi:hypothetical protein
MGGKRVRESDSSGGVRLALSEMSPLRTEGTSSQIRSLSDSDGAISPNLLGVATLQNDSGVDNFVS